MKNKNNIALLLLTSMICSPTFAYHYPWDQGHDTTTDDKNKRKPDDEVNGPEKCDYTGSPVYLKSGHLVWTDTDVVLPGQNPLKISPVFNSNDPKDGPFGKGWSFGCETSLFKIVGTEEGNGIQDVESFILRLGNGRRMRFERDATGKWPAR